MEIPMALASRRYLKHTRESPVIRRLDISQVASVFPIFGSVGSIQVPGLSVYDYNS
jgi:hypothetical protein